MQHGGSLHCQSWWGVGPVHVQGEQVVTGATYEVRAVDCGCRDNNSADFTDASSVPTSGTWVDICAAGSAVACGGAPDGLVDLNDLIGIGDKFSNNAFALPKARTDLSSGDPWLNSVDHLVTVAEIVSWLDAFEGKVVDFPFSGPRSCP